MAPNRVEKMKAMARQQPRRNLRARAAAEEEPEHLCRVCFKSFSSAQALGGHKNAHRREREEARNQGMGGLVPPPAPALNGCMYVGRPQFVYAPRHPCAAPGSFPLQGFPAGEGTTTPVRALSTSSTPVPAGFSSRGLEALHAGHGCFLGSSGVDAPRQPMTTIPVCDRVEKGEGEIDLTLHL